MAITNTYPYVLLTKVLLSSLKNRKGQSIIVNLSSSASFLPTPLMAVYSCTKVFDRYLSESLRVELKDSNVEVLTVCPMFVQTNMTLNTEPGWGTGITSCSQYVDTLVRSMGCLKPLGLIIGPPHHTT